MKVLAIAALVGGITLAGVTMSVLAGGYSEPFTSSPPAPLSYQSGHFLDGFDVQVHDRAMNRDENVLGPMQAGHGADCSPPPATHAIGSDRASAVFQCKDHFMTALNGENYGVVYLTPPAMVDFSTQGTITFEVSTEDTSPRDWWDITVSPFADSQALPLLSALSQGVDLQGPNRNAVVITTDNGEGAPHAIIVRNGADAGLPYTGALPGTSVAAGTNQAATRQTFSLTITPTHVRFERLASSTAPQLTYVDASIAALGWTQGVVQWGHHSYVPTKCDNGCSANTYHWDNFTIDPFVSLGIAPVSPKYVDGPTTLTHAAASAGAYLRFSAICTPIIDGAAGVKMTSVARDHFASYLVPIAEGSSTHTLSFRADDWYSGPCAFKDGSVFSQGGAPSPTSTGTVTPTVTASPSPSVTPTASPSPSPSASPTPFPTPTPDTRRYRCQVQARPGAPWQTVWSGSPAGRVCP